MHVLREGRSADSAACPSFGSWPATASVSARSSPARCCRSPWWSIWRSRVAATTSSSAARWGWRSGGSCCSAPWSGYSRCARWGARSWSASASCSPSRPGRRSGSPGRRAASEASRRSAASSPSSGCWRCPSRRRIARRCGEPSARSARRSPSWAPCPALAPGALLVPRQQDRIVPPRHNRLAYPLNYWNGLAALMALGIPLVLVVAVESRRLLTQALATAALPVMALAAYFTLSRGGAIEIAVALAVLLALHPRRLEVLPTLAARCGRRRARDRGGDPAGRARGQPPERGRRPAGRRDARRDPGRLRGGGPAPGGARTRRPARALAQAEGLAGRRRPCWPAAWRPRRSWSALAAGCRIGSPTPGTTSRIRRAP